MEKIYSHTMAFCPECKKKIHARIIEMDENIYLKKYCAEHGTSYAIICSDPEWYQESMSYVKPGQPPHHISIDKFAGCPDSCGLCPEHQQHTCLPIIEINNSCNMDCPVCLKNRHKPFQMSVDEFNNVLMRLFKCEQHIDIINISGGEPTIHPEFENFLALAEERNVMQTTVSTNGLQFLKNKQIRKAFKDNGVIAALQFDGFLPATYKRLRGQDLSTQKREIINILESEGIKYSLVSTVLKNVNLQETTDIVDFFFASKALSLMFQTGTLTGNAISLASDVERVTIPDVIKEIEKISHVKKDDFNPLPCCHFSCFALSYYLVIENDRHISLKEFLGKEKFLKVISNRTLPGLDNEGYSIIKEKVYDLWSAADTSSSSEMILKRIRDILRKLNSSEFSPKQAFQMGTESMKGIFIHQLMDVDTLDFGRLMKCCNHYPQVNGRLIPMCARNVFFQ